MEIKEYGQVALIRELLRKERDRIWKEEHLPLLRDKTETNVNKLYEHFIEQTNPHYRHGLCNGILKEIDKHESKIRRERSKKKGLK